MSTVIFGESVQFILGDDKNEMQLQIKRKYFLLMGRMPANSHRN